MNQNKSYWSLIGGLFFLFGGFLSLPYYYVTLNAFDEETLKKAEELIQNQKFEKARKLLIDLIDQSHDSGQKAFYFFQIGQSHEIEGNLENSEKFYLKAWQTDQKAEYGLAYAYILSELQDNGAAFEIYEELYKKFPKNLDVLYDFAQFLSIHEEFLLSLNLTNELLKIDPNHFYGKQLKAQNLFLLEQFDLAQEIYLTLHQTDPKNTDIITSLSMVSLSMKEFDQALKWNSLLLKNNSNSSDALLDRALIYEEQNNLNEALKIYDQILKQDSENLQALAKKAFLLGQRNESKEAGLKLEKELALRVGDVNAYLTLGRAYGQTAQYERSVELMKKVLETDSENIDALMSLSRAYFSLNDWHRAERYAKRAQKIEPDNQDILNQIKLYKDVKKMSYSLRRTSFISRDYDVDEEKRPTTKSSSTQVTAEISKPLNGKTSATIRLWTKEEKEEDLIFDAVDVKLKSHGLSLAINHSFNKNIFWGTQGEVSEYRQSNVTTFPLVDKTKFFGGYSFLSIQHGSFSHSFSFSRSGFTNQDFDDSKVTIAQFQTTSAISEYNFDDHGKVIAQVNYQDIEFSTDRVSSGLSIQNQLESIPGTTWGAEYLHTIHPTDSTWTAWIKKGDWLWETPIYYVLEGRASYETRGRIWDYTPSLSLSYEIFQGKEITINYDITQQDGNDRNGSQNFEISLRFSF